MQNKYNFFKPKTTLNCKGKLLNLDTPQIMAIINLTPDSFYAKGSTNFLGQSEKIFLDYIQKIIEEGADILDIGGMSTRPGAKTISEKEELERVLPYVKLVTKYYPDIILSIDTYRGTVAEACIAEGVSVINDISAGELDKKILNVAADNRVPYILMHMQGTPKDMQSNPKYKNVTLDIIDFFSKKVNELIQLGIKDIIIDPGFGFGKTLENNYQLLKELDNFKILNLPIMVGLSRKSMIYKLLETNAGEALNGSTIAHTIALLNGAKILRVHDVKEAKQLTRIYNYIDSIH